MSANGASAKVLKGLGRLLGFGSALALALLLGLLLSAGWANWARPGGPPAVRWAADSASVQVAAGPEYAAGPVWAALWGRHHRALWATPVTARVLRLGPAAPGGLRPVHPGGNFQTHSLHLQSDDGRQFVLRSVDKDARVVLPAGWLRQLLGGLLRDQTSAGLPFGAYVAAPLAEAAGVLHTNPRLVFVGNEAGLGPFRPAYANALYLLEERPKGDERHARTLGASPQVVNSAALLAALGRRPPGPATARAYLRARLLDIWLGDWSRRPDQWRWATGPGGDFRPIPRDRDQAFYQFDDGFYPWLVAQLRPRYQSFTPRLNAANVAGLARTAHPLDQVLLRGLGVADFAAEADTLQRRLNDAQLAKALQNGPPETRAALAARLRPRLVARRQQLKQVAQWYFEALRK